MKKYSRDKKTIHPPAFCSLRVVFICFESVKMDWAFLDSREILNEYFLSHGEMVVKKLQRFNGGSLTLYGIEIYRFVEILLSL